MQRLRCLCAPVPMLARACVCPVYLSPGERRVLETRNGSVRRSIRRHTPAPLASGSARLSAATAWVNAPRSGRSLARELRGTDPRAAALPRACPPWPLRGRLQRAQARPGRLLPR
eukprot:scaffold1273_cov401-Prasinococcus_capsulatus_cf.AAC.1